MKQRYVLAVIFCAVAAVVGYNMYFSLTPATHADHDHGLANLDAGGFLRLEREDGGKRNLVGRPEKVLVLHWFTPDSPEAAAEVPALLEYAASVREDAGIEVVLVASRSEWPAVREFADRMGAPMGMVYRDATGRTGDLFGVRRIPETLIYDPNGRLAHQARGLADWASAGFRAGIEAFKQGVEEVH